MKLNTKSPFYVVGFVVVISLTFTAAIMTVQVAAEDAIRLNQKLLREKALVELFDLGDMEQMTGEQISELFARRTESIRITDPQTNRLIEVLKAYSSDRKAESELIAYGFEVSGMGFWDRIVGEMAVTPDLQTIRGIVFFTHAETPGLGGRITDPQWRGKWQNLEATPPQQAAKYVYVTSEEPTGPGDPRSGRTVDAITGATGTSNAVEQFVNEDLAAFRRAAESAGLNVTTQQTQTGRD